MTGSSGRVTRGRRRAAVAGARLVAVPRAGTAAAAPAPVERDVPAAGGCRRAAGGQHEVAGRR